MFSQKTSGLKQMLTAVLRIFSNGFKLPLLSIYQSPCPRFLRVWSDIWLPEARLRDGSLQNFSKTELKEGIWTECHLLIIISFWSWTRPESIKLKRSLICWNLVLRKSQGNQKKNYLEDESQARFLNGDQRLQKLKELQRSQSKDLDPVLKKQKQRDSKNEKELDIRVRFNKNWKFQLLIFIRIWHFLAFGDREYQSLCLWILTSSELLNLHSEGYVKIRKKICIYSQIFESPMLSTAFTRVFLEPKGETMKMERDKGYDITRKTPFKNKIAICIVISINKVQQVNKTT